MVTSYWGWGGEDDDFYTRLSVTRQKLHRPPKKIARYRMMHHKFQKLNDDRISLLKKTKISRFKDGFNTIKYKVLKFELYTGFSYFLFDVGNCSY